MSNFSLAVSTLNIQLIDALVLFRAFSHEASQWLKPKVDKYGEVVEKSIDRGYLSASWTSELFSQGKEIIAKPWNPATHGKYGKKNFIIDLKSSMVTCPADKQQRITGKSGSLMAKFSAKICSIYLVKNKCTVNRP